MSEKQNKSYEDKFGKAADKVGEGIRKMWRGVDKVDNWGKQTKENINRKIDNTIKSANQKIDQWINFAKNTYKDVSKEVKDKWNQTKVNAKETIDNGTLYVQKKIAEIDGALRRLDEWMKRGTIKAIEWTAEKGTLTFLVGKQFVEVNIQKAKEQAKIVAENVKSGTIKTVRYLENQWQVVIEGTKWVVKVSLAAAIAGWLFVYRQWKYVVDQTKIAANRGIDNVKRDVKELEKDFKRITRSIDKGVRIWVNTFKTEYSKDN